MMRTLFPALVLAAAIAAVPTTARAQGGDTVYTAAAHQQFTYIAGLLVRTAEKVSEDLYSFKPTPEVRSLGAVLGHIVDDHNFMCRLAAGENPKFEAVHEKKTSKAEIVASLKESVVLCNGVFKKMNDTTGKETATAFGLTSPKLSWLNANTGHDWEHYGNLVTYMRLKKIVPPSSEKQSSAGQ